MLQVKIESFSYADKVILRNLDFSLNPGEHLSILGESGCGKSTLLHLIYGLIHLENGKISHNEKILLGPTGKLVPGEEFMKLVAQEYNIMPYTTVAENIGSYLSRMDEEKDAERIDDLLKLVDMEAFKDTQVKTLSGGQKQRVAMAKALANEPEILLFDEPFSNIDTFRKNDLRRKLFKHLKQKNISCITATHDSEEALAFSDKILMLKNGTVEMYGTPEYIYQNVSDEYQAGFFGESNLLPKSIIFSDKSSENVLLFPHELKLSKEETKLQITVQKNYFKGSHYLIKGIWNNKEVFFLHSEKLEINGLYWLSHSK